MPSSAFAVLCTLFAAVSVGAHFQLQFPPPRGVFVEDAETGFCDGYLNPAANRTEFPLSGGFFTLNSEHPQWTAGVLISTVDNPRSFNNFSQVNNFFKANGEGSFCIPLDFASSNVTTLTSGQNATIQIVFSGGDGQLYQCADVTLSDSVKIASSVACTNATGPPTSGGAAATGTSPAGTSSTPTTTTSAGVARYAATTSAMVVALAVLGLAALA